MTGDASFILDDPFAGDPGVGPYGEDHALVDLLDRLLDQGVVIAGDLTLSLADVDLLYVSLRLLVCASDALPDTPAPPNCAG